MKTTLGEDIGDFIRGWVFWFVAIVGVLGLLGETFVWNYAERYIGERALMWGWGVFITFGVPTVLGWVIFRLQRKVKLLQWELDRAKFRQIHYWDGPPPFTMITPEPIDFTQYDRDRKMRE